MSPEDIVVGIKESSISPMYSKTPKEMNIIMSRSKLVSSLYSQPSYCCEISQIILCFFFSLCDYHSFSIIK